MFQAFRSRKTEIRRYRGNLAGACSPVTIRLGQATCGWSLRIATLIPGCFLNSVRVGQSIFLCWQDWLILGRPDKPARAPSSFRFGGAHKRLDFNMSEYPFFSVVIPTYNRAALIPATLESVFSQTYPHYEVIVVDDCSTDNTDEVMESYVTAGKIRYLKNERNSERAHSRNVGLEAARGDFATLLDSDDFMYLSLI